MEVNYLKYDSIQTVQPIELNFATSDAGYFVMDCADLGENRKQKRKFSYITAIRIDLFKVRYYPNGTTD